MTCIQQINTRHSLDLNRPTGQEVFLYPQADNIKDKTFNVIKYPFKNASHPTKISQTLPKILQITYRSKMPGDSFKKSLKSILFQFPFSDSGLFVCNKKKKKEFNKSF